MSHPLVLGLFDDVDRAAAAARVLYEMGISREQVSVVAASHDAEGALARAIGASPGAEIEDSRIAARLGELGALVIAAVAIVLPGVGPIVAAGPLAAEFGEAAGHVAGGVASVLRDAGVDEGTATMCQESIEAGAVLLGAHVPDRDPVPVREALASAGARETALARWP
jgi:hypothetical protein